MSVPENQRGHGKLEACMKARELAVYTIQISANKKIFAEEYQQALTDKIVGAAIDITNLCWNANNVLVDTAEDMENRLHGLRFEVNPKKTRIYSLKEGIEFLGFKYVITETGKVLMLISPKNVKRERKKLRRLVEKSKRGGLPHEKVDESYAAWRNHASKGNSYNLLKRMDAYYETLWRDNR